MVHLSYWNISCGKDRKNFQRFFLKSQLSKSWLVIYPESYLDLSLRKPEHFVTQSCDGKPKIRQEKTNSYVWSQYENSSAQKWSRSDGQSVERLWNESNKPISFILSSNTFAPYFVMHSFATVYQNIDDTVLNGNCVTLMSMVFTMFQSLLANCTRYSRR